VEQAMSLAPQEVVVHAWDFAFDAPATIESGPTVVRLVNPMALPEVELVESLDSAAWRDTSSGNAAAFQLNRYPAMVRLQRGPRCGVLRTVQSNNVVA
jgi:hypothetical protein